jgi:hypothetical protein
MKPQPLSAQTLRRLELLFRPDDRAVAEAMLVNECGNNLPFLEKLDMVELERYRYAALKLSGGDMESLRRAVKLAQQDWRDLLMAAGFGQDITAHERWWPDRGAQ